MAAVHYAEKHPLSKLTEWLTSYNEREKQATQVFYGALLKYNEENKLTTEQYKHAERIFKHIKPSIKRHLEDKSHFSLEEICYRYIRKSLREDQNATN